MATVLIVDDSTFQQNRVASTCESAGYSVLKASTGEAGLELIEKESPDVVICDLLMPGMGGLGLLEKIQGKDGPDVIILTADIQTSVKEQCFSLGAKAFLNKPPDEKELLSEIANIVG